MRHGMTETPILEARRTPVGRVTSDSPRDPGRAPAIGRRRRVARWLSSSGSSGPPDTTKPLGADAPRGFVQCGETQTVSR